MGRPYGQPSNQKLNQGIFSENFLVKIHYAHLILQVLNFAIWEKTLKSLKLAKIKIAKVNTRHIHKITKFKLLFFYSLKVVKLETPEIWLMVFRKI